MTVRAHPLSFEPLPPEALADWRAVQPAVASDAMGRAGAMAGAISPLDPAMTLVGQARTVAAMVADNSAVHAALERAQPGQVLVIDAQGFEDAALFGGLMARAALAKGIAGVVIDGAVRDAAEIVEMGLPVFSRARTPRGPHKNFGGVLDGPISCGGVPVSSGDVILGDADGIAVVPLARLAEIRAAAAAIMAKEAKAEAAIAAGESLADLYGAPTVEPF